MHNLSYYLFDWRTRILRRYFLMLTYILPYQKLPVNQTIEQIFVEQIFDFGLTQDITCSILLVSKENKPCLYGGKETEMITRRSYNNSWSQERFCSKESFYFDVLIDDRFGLRSCRM